MVFLFFSCFKDLFSFSRICSEFLAIDGFEVGRPCQCLILLCPLLA